MGLPPVNVNELMVSGIPPVLFSVTCCGALLVCIPWAANVSVVGDKVAVAGVALVPLSATVTVPTEVLIESVAVNPVPV